MHVYTPPGYEAGKDKYPVFFLLHGSSDSDASWSTVGMAGFILDSLIADKKAKPMITVMSAGHTSRAARVPGERDPFAAEFLGDSMPYVDKHYRTQTGRAHRAMAGLSMGGGQTMNIGVPHMDQFGDEGIRMSWGILFRHEVVLNYARIQDIRLRSNAVERMLGLARIEIQTASGSSSSVMTLEGLTDHDRMRDFLYSRMRGAAEAKHHTEAGLAGVLHEVALELRAVRLVLEKRA